MGMKQKHSNTRKPKPKPTAASTQDTLITQLQRLMQAIVAAPNQRTHRPLSHEECEAMLEFYADCEMRGERAQQLYLEVWKHLQSCGRCRLSYDLLMESLQSDSLSEPDAPDTATHLPFLIPSRQHPHWTKHIRSRVGGAPLGFSYSINPQYLRNVLAFEQQTMLTRESPATGTSLFLFDTVSLDRQEIDVEVWTESLPDISQIRFSIYLTSANPLPLPLQASLQWNNRFLLGLVRQGQLVFDGIPIADLEQVQDLRLEFELKVRAG